MLSANQLLVWIEQYGYLVLLPLVTVEGPVSTVIGGFLAATGALNIYVVYIICLAGDILGDSFFYLLGYYGREKFILKWGKLFKLTHSKLELLEDYYSKHQGKTLMIGKLSYGISVPILIASGLAKVKYMDFIKYSLFASVPKVAVLVLIGYYFRHSYVEILNKVKIVPLAVTFFIILAFVIYFLMLKVSKYFEKKL